MPVDFKLFEDYCARYGYKAKDQRLDKTPANIFSTHTRNGVKVEIKVTRNKSFYVAGHGLNEYKLNFLKDQLEQKEMVILEKMAKFLKVRISDNVLDGFHTLITIIEDIDELIQRQRASRFYDAEFGDNNFLFIAGVFRLAYSLKAAGSPWSRLVIGDSLDKLAIVGYSVQGSLQEKAGKNPYREHPVPLDWIANKIFDMIKEGKPDEEIALMIKRNFKLALISNSEQDLLDNKLGLRTTMPEGYKDGDDPLTRLKFAGIEINETRKT